MTIELLQTISLILFIAAGVFFAAAAVLFFVLHIPAVIGDISGATAKKAIAGIRQQNEETGGKAYKPSPVNSARGKLTDKISPSGNLEIQRTGRINATMNNAWLNTEQLPQTGEETTVLEQIAETTVLQQTAETTVLQQVESVSPIEQTIPEYEDNNAEFSIDYEIGFSGSSEIIE